MLFRSVSLAKLAPAAAASRHLPCTPQCASPGGFFFYRKIQRSFPIEKRAPVLKGRGLQNSWYHLYSQTIHTACLHECYLPGQRKPVQSLRAVTCTTTSQPTCVNHCCPQILRFRCEAPRCIRKERCPAPLTSRRLSVFSLFQLLVLFTAFFISVLYLSVSRLYLSSLHFHSFTLEMLFRLVLPRLTHALLPQYPNSPSVLYLELSRK